MHPGAYLAKLRDELDMAVAIEHDDRHVLGAHALRLGRALHVLRRRGVDVDDVRRRWADHDLVHVDRRTREEHRALVGERDDGYRIRCAVRRQPRPFQRINVLRPGGECHVEVPYFAAVSAYADPTHRAWFTYTTFEHFGPPATSGRQAHLHTWFGSARFGIRRRRLVFGEAHRRLGLQALANRFPALYENLLLYLFPARSLEVELVRLG